MPLKTEFIPYSFREKEACPAMQGNRGKQHVWLGGRSRSKGKAQLRLSLCFLQEKARKAAGNSLGLDSLPNIRGSGDISRGPVPGPGVIQAQVRELGKGVWGCGLRSSWSPFKDMLLSEFCTTLGISQLQGMQSLPSQQGLPRCQNTVK